MGRFTPVLECLAGERKPWHTQLRRGHFCYVLSRPLQCNALRIKGVCEGELSWPLIGKGSDRVCYGKCRWIKSKKIAPEARAEPIQHAVSTHIKCLLSQSARANLTFATLRCAVPRH